MADAERGGGFLIVRLENGGTGEVIDAVVWVSDLSDFTRLSETLSSRSVSEK